MKLVCPRSILMEHKSFVVRCLHKRERNKLLTVAQLNSECVHMGCEPLTDDKIAVNLSLLRNSRCEESVPNCRQADVVVTGLIKRKLHEHLLYLLGLQFVYSRASSTAFTLFERESEL